MNYNEIMRELAHYTRIADEAAAIADGLKDQLKNYMVENSLETLIGEEHKAIYKAVKSTRVDTTAFKKELPDIAARYSKTSETMRFTFA